jgi:hypothetical protein
MLVNFRSFHLDISGKCVESIRHTCRMDFDFLSTKCVRIQDNNCQGSDILERRPAFHPPLENRQGICIGVRRDFEKSKISVNMGKS